MAENQFTYTPQVPIDNSNALAKLLLAGALNQRPSTSKLQPWAAALQGLVGGFVNRQAANQQAGNEAYRRDFLRNLPTGDRASISSCLLSSSDPDFRKAGLTAYANQPTELETEKTKAEIAKLNAEAAGGGSIPKPRQFSVSDTDKLSEQSTSYGELGSLIKTFKDKYSGYTFPIALEYAKKGFPTPNGPDDREASDWWDGYKQWAEPARKLIYGVLNRGDAEAFDSARVTPSTDPKTVKSNLAKQQQILFKAIQRKSDVLKASGYQPEAVDAALGVEAPPQPQGITVNPVRTMSVNPDGSMTPTNASTATPPVSGGMPSIPSPLAGKKLQWNPTMQLFRDETGRLYNRNGEPVQ
jgi:hypothetical protein